MQTVAQIEMAHFVEPACKCIAMSSTLVLLYSTGQGSIAFLH